MVGVRRGVHTRWSGADGAEEQVELAFDVGVQVEPPRQAPMLQGPAVRGEQQVVHDQIRIDLAEVA